MSSESSSISNAWTKKPCAEIVLILHKSEFLTVRNKHDDFSIYRALHDVYHEDTKIKIQWFLEVKDGSFIYTPAYKDTV